MLYALRQPAAFLGILLGFAAGLFAIGAVTRLANRKVRSPAPYWHPRSWVDPYGAVAALLAGVGWPPRNEVHRPFGRSRNAQLWLTVAVSFAVPAVLGAAGVIGYAALAGRPPLSAMNSMAILHGEDFLTYVAPTFAEKLLLGFGIEGLAIAFLMLVPLPPLPMGVALWTIFPRAAGARQLAYRLLDEHWGLVAVLALVVVPLSRDGSLLMVLITTVVDDILHAF